MSSSTPAQAATPMPSAATAATPATAPEINAGANSGSGGDRLELPAHNSTYKKKEYWDERFQKEEKYEWLSGYASFRALLRPLLTPDSRILHIGCGNSDLGRELYRDGFTRITNIDYSAPAIEAQRKRNADCAHMDWRVLDLEQLESAFAPGTFDVVLDKCTLDALLVDEGDPWNPRAEVREQVGRVLRGISHVLKPNGGKYLQLSFGQPVHRLPYFRQRELNWEVAHSTWGDTAFSFGFFFYCMTRSTDAARLDALEQQRLVAAREEEQRAAQLAEQMRRAFEESEREQSDEQRMMFNDW